ncbi:fibroblast growth factor 23-like [Takifugu rubripes]|uniref:fibroblast growth factor 23-like n=1 Tax=Takifugu rubripes TaxID=31033 RepID=UPI000065FD03|nr:fibroblast growth factor 23-like [Takifugu rubripes]|eukprot:XP_011605136.1 PREDICTED: fibroblast growth factor 23-like [Takifugu rubripes]
MQAAFLSFILVAVRLFVPLDCTMRPQDPEPHLQPRRTSPVKQRSWSGFSRSEKKGIHSPFLMILPLKTETSNFVLIFNLQKRRFLCLDSKGQRYHSKLKNGEDCLFQRIWLHLDTPYQVFYSVSGGQLLKLERGRLRVVGQNQPQTPSAQWERLLLKRGRRSHDVNPSDPLRSQADPSHSAKEPTGSDHRPPEQDQAGAVSKETINSCDDPLRVLQSNGQPVSPIKTNIADRPDQD